MDGHQERRQTTLTDNDIEKLREMIYSGIPADEHKEHHEAMRVWVKRENQKAERYEKVKTHVIGWGAISFLSGVVFSFGQWLKAHFHF